MSANARPTPKELESWLDQADITNGLFCEMTGINERTLQRWLKGEQDIPEWTRTYCLMLTVDKARQLAEWLTREMKRAA